MPRLIDLLSEHNHMNRFSKTPEPGVDTVSWGPQTVCFVVDNISEYYYHHDQEYWCFKDFPYPYPLFKHLWVEYKLPKDIRSKEVGVTDTGLTGVDGYFGCFLDEIKPDLWSIVFGLYYLNNREIRAMGVKEAHIPLSRDSECVNEVTPIPKAQQDMIGPITQGMVVNVMYLTHPVWMAFRVHKGKYPLREFHMVNVLPLGQHARVTRTVTLGPNLAGTVGDIKLRRGSFATYKDEDGHRLFGKYTGRYWRPAVQKADIPEAPKYDVRVKRMTAHGNHS